MGKLLFSSCRIAFVALLLQSLLVPQVQSMAHRDAGSQAAPHQGAWSPVGSLQAARMGHTATLLPNGQVLVAGGKYRDSETGESHYLASAELYDPTNGSWSVTLPMSAARSGHTATLLLDGRVLVAGGAGDFGSSNSAEIYDPATATWSPAGAPICDRLWHTATRLPDGRVLMAGGLGDDGVLDSAEIYDPVTDAWSSTGPLGTRRHAHTATLLLNGRVLAVGGHDGSNVLASAEVYDPATGVWNPAGELSAELWWHTATLLADGRVLVAGGFGTATVLADAQLYDPAAEPGSAWSPTGSMASHRAMHSAALLPDGRVLVAGGSNGYGAFPGVEVYDLAAGTWSLTGSMVKPRAIHSATLLLDGRVLAAGGMIGNDRGYPLELASAEVYDPAAPSGPWTPTGGLRAGRYSHTTTLLPDGRILAAGGYHDNSELATAETYDPLTGSWSSTGSLSTARANHTATLLADGRVLVAGGRSNNGLLASAEIYDPTTGTWAAAASMSADRVEHTATLLTDGRVLVVGGFGGTGAHRSAEVYDPTTDAWTPAGSMAVTRLRFTATLLTDGRVLLVGGSVWAELYDPATGSWSLTGAMGISRVQHTATLLPDGRVLVAGGFDGHGNLTSAELYDPAVGAWVPTGSLGGERREHSATLLPDGRVLVAGGYGLPGGDLASVELYDASTRAWSPAVSMAITRIRHSATLLADGRLLVVGGQGYGELSIVEVYDADYGAWSTTGMMNGSRGSHTATLLSDGRVLAAGGQRYDDGHWLILDSAEMYDPELETWIETASMHSPRSGHSATLLPGGPVLVAGGWNGGPLGSTEMYHPAGRTWSATAPMGTARGWHTATLLPDGRVLVAGGNDEAGPLASAELYDPVADAWTRTGPMGVARALHTATLLPNGKVLVAGGCTSALCWQSAAELYDPATGVWSPTESMTEGRDRHTATLLPDGRVLVVGGLGWGDVGLATAEVYDPISGSWIATGSMAAAREGHQAILLPDGTVLVTGGFDSGGSGYVASTEVYDPATGVWSLDAPPGAAVVNCGLTLLADGRLLRSGGFGYDGAVNSAEVYDPGLGANLAWRPLITTVTSPLLPGSALSITGSGFRGYGLSEASGGATNNSATNYPLVQLRRLDNGQVRWLLPDPNWPFSATAFTALPIAELPGGPHLLTVVVNGIPSLSHMIVASNVTLPPIARDDAYTTDEDMPLRIAAPGVLGNDLDFNGDQLAAALISQPMSGTLVLRADGSFVFTPSLNLNGTDVFTYQVSDGIYAAVATARLTLLPINDPPILDLIEDRVVDEETTLSFVATATDPDVGDTLAFWLSEDAPAGADIDPATGEFTWTPNEAQGPGTHSITIHATDDGLPALDDFETFSVTVNEVNRAPVAAADTYLVDEDTLLSVAAPGVLSNDLDGDLPAQTLTASVETGPAHGILVLGPDGSFLYTPAPGYYGADTFIYTASDGNLSDTAIVSITVRTVCDLVLIKAASTDQVWPGASLTYTLTVTNRGPSDSTAITVTDWLPAAEALLAASRSCSSSGGFVICLPDPISAGGTTVLTLTVSLNVTATGILSNTAMIAGAELDPDLANNLDRAEVWVGDFYRIYLPLVVQHRG